MNCVLAGGLLAVLGGCSGAGPNLGEALRSEPRYDGGYVWTTRGRFEEADWVQARESLWGQYYAMEREPELTLPADRFQGFFVKGNYEFEYFSIHPLRSGYVETGPAFDALEFFAQVLDRPPSGDAESVGVVYPGPEIGFRSFESDHTNGYYFEVEERLQPGRYVAWIGYDFWIFELTE